MLPPQDADEAWELILRMEDYYREAFDGFEEDDIFYEGLLDEFFNVPPGAHVTIPTTARAVVDEAVDTATPKNIMVAYAPRKNTKGAEADADTIRMFIKAMWAYWRNRGGDIDILRDFLKNLFKSGKAVYKVHPDWTLWPQLTDETKAEIREECESEEEAERMMSERAELIKKVRAENFPYVCRSIAPSCIMEDPSIGRKLWIIERYEAAVEEIRATYALDVEELRGYYAASYPVHEVWTATYIDWRGRLVTGKHYVFVNWELVREAENPRNGLPYVVKYSGFGREAYEGKPEYKSVGFYTRQNKSMFLAEMRRFTHFDAIMSQLAYPIAFLPVKAEMSSIDFTPGAVNYVPDDVMAAIDKVWVQPKIPDAEYLASLGAIAAQIERGTVQRAIRGAGVPGTDSAAQLGMITQQATLRIDSAIQATQQAMTEVSQMVLQDIDTHLKADVTIGALDNRTDRLRIGPKNIQGDYNATVEFAPNEDQAKERKLILANDAIAKGGLSRYDAYVFAGFDNPTELIARKLADDLMAQPQIMKYFAKLALKEWGEDIDEIELEARVDEAKQQAALNEIMNMLQLGTLSGVGDPNTPDGSPPGGGMPQPPMPPQGAEGMPGVPGAPPMAAQGPLAGLTQDIDALQAGV